MRDFKLYIIVLGLLVGIYLVAEFNKPSPVNWTPTLYYGDKVPLGTYVVYHRLTDIFPGAKITKTNASFYKIFQDTTLSNGNYLVVAKGIDINKVDFKEMVKYLKKGNSIFISAFSFNGFLADTLKLDVGYEYQNRNSTLNFVNNQLKRPVDYLFKKDICNQYFNQYDTARAIVIGKNDSGHSTFISYKFGAGTLYLCTNPAVFTNYSLLTDAGAEYAAKALSYMPASDNVYWDEFQNGDIPEDESPIRVFMNNGNLQWAYYISLFGLLLFVIYEIKRRQRVIPIVEPLANSTLGFVNVVGQVYYEQRNNANIAQKKIIYLLESLREDYRVKTNKLDEEFIETLNSKLNIDRATATDLVRFIKNIDSQGYVSDNELIELNRLIEKIYKQIA